MIRTSPPLALQRLKPGPFGGFFDGLPYDHPVFRQWLILELLLILAMVAIAYLALLHIRRHRSRAVRGFEVMSKSDVKPTRRDNS